jgi:hypothetical protein
MSFERDAYISNTRNHLPLSVLYQVAVTHAVAYICTLKSGGIALFLQEIVRQPEDADANDGISSEHASENVKKN